MATAHFDKGVKTMRVGLNKEETQILIYALRDFMERYSLMDDKAKDWARKMDALRTQIIRAM